MAEIKSTLAIVLEKTKHLVLTPEEREAMERREHLEKVPGIVQRFVDGAWSVDHMQEAWRHIPEAFREEARRHILQRLLDALSDEHAAEKLIPAMEAFASQVDMPYIQRLARLVTQDMDPEQSWEARRRKLLADLAEKGIRGDAVHIPPTLDPRWHLSQRAMHDALEALKAEWRAAHASTAPR